ncbi:MAG: bifunctional chorismate mutase/prephenate dehydratase [Candidatus Marinimicrobia bacterium]|nr:bifunctional chorismate mutase/prephenate dehydratase [Candidatus Neomarinimicrobiota bacterium]
MDLEDIRNQINIIDSKILKLLNDRMEQAIIARKFKTEIEDIEREKEILYRIKNSLGQLISANFCEKLFVDIINESKRLQKKGYKVIGFQGEHGAYSEVASKIWNKDLVSAPCKDFSKVFEGVKSGLFDYGIVPVENTLGGVVGQVNDLIINTDLYVVGAIDFPVNHCLLTVPDADYREIRSVYSHPQALAQCRQFLKRNKLQPISHYDTAGAARMISEKNLRSSAVIASKMSADLYNLEIIKENIEDLEINNTRFLILSKEKFEGVGNKCSIIFSTEHKSGTLFSVLEVFAKANINLTRIESIPKQPGTYAFFLDFIGSDKDEKVIKAIDKVSQITKELRFMGCYNERKI